PVRCLAFAPGGSRLATGAAAEGGGEILLWHIDPRLQERDTLLCSAADVTALAFAADGRTLITGVTDQVFGPRGQHLAMETSLLLLKRWELGGPRDGLPRATSVPIPTTDPIARLLTVGFSRDGGLLALESTGWSARQQVYLKLWDL